jgi:Na+/H+ antiporter NhaA
VRSIPRSIALATVVGVAVVAAGIAVVAMPLFLVARVADPTKGLDDPTVRTGLVVAVVFGVVVGTAAGVWTGRWYRRGGHLPTE